MSDVKIRDLIFGMPTRFAAEKAIGLEATVQFLINGQGGIRRVANADIKNVQ